MAINGEISMPILNEERRFLMGANIGSVILFIASAWQLVAMVIAVRQALDYRSTWRAVAVVVISFIISMIPLIILQSLMSPSPAGI